MADPQELLDIVDKDLTVVSQATKQQAHEQGLLHKTVIGEIINSKGEWALVIQAGHKQDPGQYVSPVGGHVKAGESDDDALKREALEECGIKDFTFEKKGAFIFDREVQGHRENHYFIVYAIHTDAEITLNDESVLVERFAEADLKYRLHQNPKNFGAAFTVIVDTLYTELKS